MRKIRKVPLRIGVFGVVVLATLSPAFPVPAADGEPQPSAAEVTPDPWPRTAKIGGSTYSDPTPPDRTRMC